MYHKKFLYVCLGLGIIFSSLGSLNGMSEKKVTLYTGCTTMGVPPTWNSYENFENMAQLSYKGFKNIARLPGILTNAGIKLSKTGAKLLSREIDIQECENKIEKVKLLLKYGYTKRAKKVINYPEDSNIFFSSENRNCKTIRLVLPYCSLETINQVYGCYEETLLSIACENNDVKLVKRLLRRCSQKTINRDYNLLRKAFENNQVEIVKLLLPYYSPRLINQGEEPLLYKAIKYNNPKMAKLLIPYYYYGSQRKKYVSGKIRRLTHSWNPLKPAYEYERTKIIELLLPHCTKEAISDAAQTYPRRILHAIEEGDITQVKKLVEKQGYSINKSVGISDRRGPYGTIFNLFYPYDYNFKTYPLHHAVKNVKREIVKYLVNNGAKLNVINAQGETPLSCAAARYKYHKSDFKIAEMLEAGYECETEVARARLYLKTRLNAFNKTPLSCFVTGSEYYKSNFAIAVILIEAGADINLNYPLHDAIASGQREMARYLIDCGANLELKNKDKNTPLDIALLVENKELGIHLKTALEYQNCNNNANLIIEMIEKSLQQKNEQKVKDIVNIALKRSIRDFFKNKKTFEETLFYKLFFVSRFNENVRGVFESRLKLARSGMYKKELAVCRNMLLDLTERRELISKRDKFKQVEIKTTRNTIFVPQILLSI